MKTHGKYSIDESGHNDLTDRKNLSIFAGRSSCTTKRDATPQPRNLAAHQGGHQSPLLLEQMLPSKVK